MKKGFTKQERKMERSIRNKPEEEKVKIRKAFGRYIKKTRDAIKKDKKNE